MQKKIYIKKLVVIDIQRNENVTPKINAVINKTDNTLKQSAMIVRKIKRKKRNTTK